jgi:3-dehydroquinate synthase
VPYKRTILLALLVLVLIGVSFWLYGPAIDAWTDRVIQQASSHPWQAAGWLTALLASDILLPVPSSLASVACGLALGFWGGLAASFLGMTISTILGYWLGFAVSGKASRWLGEREKTMMEAFYDRYGLWMLLALRPVPMLAEASVLFSGVARQPFLHVMGVAALGNLTVSAVYSAIGTWGKVTDSFFPAFGAALLVSGILLLVCKKRGFKS